VTAEALTEKGGLCLKEEGLEIGGSKDTGRIYQTQRVTLKTRRNWLVIAKVCPGTICS